MGAKSVVLASLTVMLTAAPIFANAKSPSYQFALTPMTFRGAQYSAMPAFHFPSSRRLWFKSQISLNSQGSRTDRTPVTLPTMQPTSRLRWDLTPLVPCPPGEYRVWSSFGSMPAAERAIAGYMGYTQSSLCAPIGHPWVP